MSNKVLLHGSRGQEVRIVQQELKNRVAPGLPVTGYYGDLTEHAVWLFQKQAGFKGPDLDGKVGPKTMAALFPVVDIKVQASIASKAQTQSSAPANPNQSAKPTVTPPANPPDANKPPEGPDRLQVVGQIGPQLSNRDGAGSQINLAFTYLTRPLFPHSNKSSVYHGATLQLQPSLTLGLPVPSGSIYTGQLNFLFQPITDWLVLWDRVHLLTPQIGQYSQVPINHDNSLKMRGIDDPSTHARIGGYIGAEIFHVDILKDRLAIGANFQENIYWDFHSGRVICDPSVSSYLQWTFGAPLKYKPASN
jgi:hypothetical protein